MKEGNMNYFSSRAQCIILYCLSTSVLNANIALAKGIKSKIKGHIL